MRAPTVLIAPTRGLFDLDLKADWEYRELLDFMVWRDVKVRYKQTVIGVAWVVRRETQVPPAEQPMAM